MTADSSAIVRVPDELPRSSGKAGSRWRKPIPGKAPMPARRCGSSRRISAAPRLPRVARAGRSRLCVFSRSMSRSFSKPRRMMPCISRRKPSGDIRDTFPASPDKRSARWACAPGGRFRQSDNALNDQWPANEVGKEIESPARTLLPGFPDHSYSTRLRARATGQMLRSSNCPQSAFHGRPAKC